MGQSRPTALQQAQGYGKCSMNGPTKDFTDFIVVVTTALSFLIVSLMFSLV